MRRKVARDEAHISLQSINPILCSVYIGEFPSPSRQPATLLQPAKVHSISYLHIKRISTKSTCTQSFPPRSDGFWAGALLSTLRTRELIPKNPIPRPLLAAVSPIPIDIGVVHQQQASTHRNFGPDTPHSSTSFPAWWWWWWCVDQELQHHTKLPLANNPIVHYLLGGGWLAQNEIAFFAGHPFHRRTASHHCLDVTLQA